MSRRPDISVVIPTCNHAEDLLVTLDCLVSQKLPAARTFEIIIVDDGSQDETPREVRRYLNLDTERPRIRFYRQKNQFSGAARNLGVRVSDSGIVLSMDDDMAAVPGLVASHLAMHECYPEPAVLVLGRILVDRGRVDLCDPDRFRVMPERMNEKGDPVLDIAAFTTQNVSFKKELLFQAGLFTPGLPRLDDLELAFRLDKIGVELIYCEEAAAYHRRPIETLSQIIESGRFYGRTLSDWYDRIPVFRCYLSRLGGRFDGGWRHFNEDPAGYLKDAVRRYMVNRYTIGFLINLAKRLPRRTPPGKFETSVYREIWAYCYREAFNRHRCKKHRPQGVVNQTARRTF